MSNYITPLDMRSLYENEILIEATNYSDRTATTINEQVLTGACETGSQLVDGYLVMLPIKEFSPRFLAIVRIHAGRLAIDQLAATDPQVREQAKESIDWLKSLQKLNDEELENLAGNVSSNEEAPLLTGVPVYSIGVVDEGRRWNITF